MHSWLPVKKGREVRPCNEVVENRFQEFAEALLVEAPRVMNRGMEKSFRTKP